MPSFRRLPLFLRMVWVLERLFLITALTVFVASLSSIALFLTANDPRVATICLNLAMLSQACSTVINRYSKRFRQPDGGPFSLDSWQSQAQAIALLAALPLCGLMLAAIIPQNQVFAVVFPITFMGLLVGLFARAGRLALG